MTLRQTLGLALWWLGCTACGTKAGGVALDVKVRVGPGATANFIQLAAWSTPAHVLNTPCFRNTGAADMPIAVFEGGALGASIQLQAGGYADSACTQLTSSSAPPTSAVFGSGGNSYVLVLSAIAASDAGADAGPTPDSGQTTPDSGNTTPDSGHAPDSGNTTPDSGNTTPDSGTAPDAGGTTPDSGTTPPDSGTTPDAGSPTPDAGVDAGFTCGPSYDAGQPCGLNGVCDVDGVCVPAFTYPVSNFDAGSITSIGGPFVVGCQQVVDASKSTKTVSICGTTLTAFQSSQGTGNAPAVVVAVAGLVVNPGAGLHFAGPSPFIFAVYGDAVINGYLTASATGPDAGPGTDGPFCQAAGMAPGGGGKIGGAGGGGNGYAGGAGGMDTSNGKGGTAGTSSLSPTLSPLVGGCSGAIGSSGGGPQPGPAHGGGGGALQVSASGALTVGSGGFLAASGGGGGASTGFIGGAGGGGSGGGVLLEAKAIDLAAGSAVTANGGGGGAGLPVATNQGPGQDGNETSATPAPGGLGTTTGIGGSTSTGGNGGPGGAGASGPGTNGANGSSTGAFGYAGGGGGGGGAGFIRLNATNGCTENGTLSGNKSGPSGC